MKRTWLKKISDKRRTVLEEENQLYQHMLLMSNGRCWICMARFAVEKNHNRRRDKFVPSCHVCHYPINNEHRYLDDVPRIKFLGK